MAVSALSLRAGLEGGTHVAEASLYDPVTQSYKLAFGTCFPPSVTVGCDQDKRRGMHCNASVPQCCTQCSNVNVAQRCQSVGQ
jgi:hypothetical protein